MAAEPATATAPLEAYQRTPDAGAARRARPPRRRADSGVPGAGQAAGRTVGQHQDAVPLGERRDPVQVGCWNPARSGCAGCTAGARARGERRLGVRQVSSQRAPRGCGTSITAAALKPMCWKNGGYTGGLMIRRRARAGPAPGRRQITITSGTRHPARVVQLCQRGERGERPPMPSGVPAGIEVDSRAQRRRHRLGQVVSISATNRRQRARRVQPPLPLRRRRSRSGRGPPIRCAWPRIMAERSYPTSPEGRS
jgi:hypothetical protein